MFFYVEMFVFNTIKTNIWGHSLPRISVRLLKILDFGHPTPFPCYIEKRQMKNKQLKPEPLYDIISQPLTVADRAAPSLSQPFSYPLWSQTEM